MTCTLCTGFSAGTRRRPLRRSPPLPLYRGEKLVLKTKTWEYANKYSLPKEKLLETFRLLFKIIKVLKRAINRVLLSLYPSFCTHWQNKTTTFCFTMFQLHFSYTSAIFQLNFIRTIFQIFFSYIMLFQLYLSFISATF